MNKAEERAMEAYPDMTFPFTPLDLNAYRRRAFIQGYEAAEKDILAIIESRISEIIGDAQPKPAMRMELQELINKIKEENND